MWPTNDLGGLSCAAQNDLVAPHEVDVRPVREDDGRAGLRDGELLGRDRLEGVAEHVGVLEPDVRQQDDARAKHVRRVVPAAETRLDHRDVDGRVREGCERGRGDRFELRRVELLRGGTDAADC